MDRFDCAICGARSAPMTHVHTVRYSLRSLNYRHSMFEARFLGFDRVFGSRPLFVTHGILAGGDT